MQCGIANVSYSPHFKALLFGFFGMFLMGYGVYYQIERYIGTLLKLKVMQHKLCYITHVGDVTYVGDGY